MPCRCFIAFLSCEFSVPLVFGKGCLLTVGGRLLFMTYNGLVMLAVAVGAFVGYLAFGQDSSATKSVACH